MDQGQWGKNTDFTDFVLNIPCQTLPWTMGLMIYGKGRTQNPLSSLTRVGHLPVISFIDHCNAISIDRLPSKTEI